MGLGIFLLLESNPDGGFFILLFIEYRKRRLGLSKVYEGKPILRFSKDIRFSNFILCTNSAQYRRKLLLDLIGVGLGWSF